MKIIDTYINFALDCSDIENLSILENGESRLITKTNSDDIHSSILVLEFSQRHTQFLIKGKLNQQILFLNGTYQIMKNKNGTPFINVKVAKIVAKNKKYVVDIRNIRSNLCNDFENNDLNYLTQKYIDSCTSEEIKNLKEVIAKRDLLRLQSQLKSKEVQKLKHEKKILQLKQSNTNVI
jgi:hypothetical protein